MNDKLAVILVSADPDVLDMGLIYAVNVVNRQWIPDLRVYLFGPSEVTIVTHPELAERIKMLIKAGIVPEACIDCSDKHNVTEPLRELGCIVRGIGQPVTEAIREGYVPMSW